LLQAVVAVERTVAVAVAGIDLLFQANLREVEVALNLQLL
jgi:hypothetical protein